MDHAKMTRAQAERIAARTSDEETLRHLSSHKNKHVRAKATFKLARLEKATLKLARLAAASA